MKGNIKALTNDELKFVNERYDFKLTEYGILVIANGRKTLHEFDKSFSLLLPLERRIIKIKKSAIDLWSKKYIDKYSLIEVQNAINTLAVTFQNIAESTIDEQIKVTRSKLNNLR